MRMIQQVPFHFVRHGLDASILIISISVYQCSIFCIIALIFSFSTRNAFGSLFFMSHLTSFSGCSPQCVYS